MKILSVAILLAVISCDSHQPIAQVTLARVGKFFTNNSNVRKVVNQLSELHKAKGVRNFTETRRALGGVISDYAGHELHPIFVQERYRTTILDLYRSYTEDHFHALDRVINKFAGATNPAKIDSYLREIKGLIKKINSNVKQRDTIFQRVMPYNQRATNIRNDIEEFIRWQQKEISPELQNKLTNAIFQTLDKYDSQGQRATMLIVGERLRQELAWIF